MAANKLFPMNLSFADGQRVMQAVNLGIDSNLQACNVPDRGDLFAWVDGKLVCAVSTESLRVLVRRLKESREHASEELAADIAHCFQTSMRDGV